MRYLPLLTLAALLPAAERQFTVTQESNVLAPGQKEVEFHVTQAQGREAYFRSNQERLELEVGVAPGWQVAVYLNHEAERAWDGTALVTEQATSWSGEVKHQLSDAAADALGAALYGEVTVGNGETAAEAKLILDRQFGPCTAALNLVTEAELPAEPDARIEWEGALTAGLTTRLPGHFAAGVEAVWETTWENEGDGYLREKSVLLAGPVVHWASEALWATASVLPQITSFEEHTSGHLDLEHAERVTARLIVGTHW